MQPSHISFLPEASHHHLKYSHYKTHHKYSNSILEEGELLMKEDYMWFAYSGHCIDFHTGELVSLNEDSKELEDPSGVSERV